MSLNIEPSLFFIIDSSLPIITLSSVLIFDYFFKERNKGIYLFLLFYIALIIGYYVTIIFTSLSLWLIFLGVMTLLMIVYTFIFPLFYYFRRYTFVSRSMGMYIGYIVSVAVVMSIILETISLFYSFILIISLIYQYTLYRFFRNYISYIVFLTTLIFLYLKIFLILGNSSFITSLIFIFLLPYLFIGVSYIFYMKFAKEIYILHLIGISMSIVAIIYYFIAIGSIYDILSLSILSFFESILIFMSYVRLKK